ncbi:ankyrin repeat domain-containing protein [Paucibacter sp. AS339]|uniref:ankyrin repeat domain-containing protein n=1 Tax=Paucibacter hankyongi TaxID=3133434 RepID=UPI0030A99476
MDGGNWKEMFNAACEGDLALVRYHMERGVDVNYAHPEFLSTPLVACILAGQEQIALFLLDAGANPSLASEFDACTPLQAARQAKLEAVAERLLQMGEQEEAEVKRATAWKLGPWFHRLLSGGRSV